MSQPRRAITVSLRTLGELICKLVVHRTTFYNDLLSCRVLVTIGLTSCWKCTDLRRVWHHHFWKVHTSRWFASVCDEVCLSHMVCRCARTLLHLCICIKNNFTSSIRRIIYRPRTVAQQFCNSLLSLLSLLWGSIVCVFRQRVFAFLQRELVTWFRAACFVLTKFLCDGWRCLCNARHVPKTYCPQRELLHSFCP